MNRHSFVFSCDRPALLADCVAGLAPFSPVTVIDDASTKPLPKVDRLLKVPNRMGRAGFGNLWQMAFNNAKISKYDIVLFSPDDFGQWDIPLLERYLKDLPTNRPWCLNYTRDHRDICWKYGPNNKVLHTEAGTLRGMQWMDCGIVINRKALEMLDYKMPVVPERWLARGISSGVGKYLSEKLVRSGVSIWQVPISVCSHLGNECSKMNPKERLEVPIILTKALRRTANIATMPERHDSLLRTLESLKGQFDEIRIYLNGYQTAPEDLKQYTTATGPNLTDNGKFYWLDKSPNELYYTMDDDLIYPPDWADRLQREAKPNEIVTWHGRKLRGMGQSYYHATDGFPCLRDVDKSVLVDVGGTGVMMVNTNTFKSKLWDSPYKCMADLVLAHEAAKRRIPIRVLAHKEGELKLIEQPPMTTIYEKYHKRCPQQNALADAIWVLKYGKPKPNRTRGFRW